MINVENLELINKKLQKIVNIIDMFIIFEKIV